MKGHGGGLIPPSGSPPPLVVTAGYLLFHASGYMAALARESLILQSTCDAGGFRALYPREITSIYNLCNYTCSFIISIKRKSTRH